MSKNAVVLRPRGINHNGKFYRKGATIKDMAANQLADWEGVGIVREATPDKAETKAAKAE